MNHGKVVHTTDVEKPKSQNNQPKLVTVKRTMKQLLDNRQVVDSFALGPVE